MAVAETQRGPRGRADRFHSRARVAILATLGVALVGCGDGLTADQRAAAELRGKVRTAYAAAVDAAAPQHVILTWPERFDRLAADKQLEIEVLHEVLVERGLPTTRGRIDDFLETIEVGRGRRARELPAWVVPVPIAEACRDATVLFVNFAVPQRFSAAQHPRTRDFGLTVLVWDDPVSIDTRRVSF